MLHHPGMIAEYGTQEFNDNKVFEDVLERGQIINSCGIIKEASFYHRPEGYHLAGSCGSWNIEIWGVKIFYDDGTTGGRQFKTYSEALNYWHSIKA